MNRTLLVMAGGTGGHVFPGLAVADLLKSRDWKVVWMGAPDGMEAKLVPPRGYEMAWVRFAALRGKGLLRKLLLPFHLFAACWQARREIRRVRPDVVLGMGGYVSFPGGMMAALLGCPLIIHEQNSIAGLANRVLARFARRVACGFPDALPSGVWVGNPLRPEMSRVPAPAQRLAGRQAPLHLLVLGGSQGAAALNDIVPRGLALIDAEQRPLCRASGGREASRAAAARTTRRPRCRRTARLSSKTWPGPTSGLTW
jgi:UDP-N-acetylglucosamine--N-acetylmuramyl-(pentapeptide) pyrophosphoryl-undecaprenol N-acetylglucosamine transferase